MLLTLKKLRLHHFKWLFQALFKFFDLKCHVQTTFKVVFVMFRLTFIKFKVLKILHWENKKNGHHKNLNNVFV